MNPESRRSACDRCRGQKLRCVRPVPGEGDHHAVEPCRRCLRAGTECIDSSASSLYHHPWAGSARIYESIAVATTALDAAPAAPVESVPAKRKRVPPFLEQDFHPIPEHHRDTSTGPVLAVPDPSSAVAQQPFGVEPLGFGMGLGLGMIAGHQADQFIDTPFLDPTMTASTIVHPAVNLDLPPHSESTCTGTKADCLQSLSRLNFHILHDASRIRSTPLADILCSFSAWPDSRQSQPEPGMQNSIGRVLDLTQAFLNILQSLKLALSPSAPPSSLRSPASSTSSDHPYSEYYTDLHGRPMSFAQCQSINLNHIQFLQSTPSPNTPTPASCAGLDMPTTMSILTCYIWLLHTYGTILDRIYDSLSATELTSPIPSSSFPPSTAAHFPPPAAATTPIVTTPTPTPSIPSVLPGLHIGGFDLTSHRDLQLEILLQLIAKMLGRVEQILGISLISIPQSDRDDNQGRKGILDRDAAGALLEIILKRNGLGLEARYHQNAGGDASSVKRTLECIRERLGGIMG
ncbi:hypothetical protein BO71DRAFT_397810 [Aspergillus ellipticus CBS 707.79]|uniref:Zn(2)-C6 fungal-type domain-containing protein n=1 Tax=Aspergillus ellipticus CBS 707.79 TaxID=1448320 RepID=A0A319DEL9_9EURO|nr:hypothetical protein BO71DRAFT_397810 [Aspergillus ellipticus CBS 707.79]